MSAPTQRAFAEDARSFFFVLVFRTTRKSYEITKVIPLVNYDVQTNDAGVDGRD